MTLSDLKWPFHGSSLPSVWEGRANVNALSALKSTSSASRAISAVAKLLVISVFLLTFIIVQC